MAISLEDKGTDSSGFGDELPLISPASTDGKKGLESVRINSILTPFQLPYVTAP
ncbi:hypothetical protein ABDX87_23435 [Pseudomonas abietaniphila]|uniref:hypothetical protein n=1 Tax=Pseudomonas abietaniphila TaxID=89065 RepID=UPI003216BB9E